MSAAEPTNIDLNSLPPQQLVEFRKSIDEKSPISHNPCKPCLQPSQS